MYSECSRGTWFAVVEFLRKASGIKFADGNNSAGIKLLFKSDAAAIKAL